MKEWLAFGPLGAILGTGLLAFLNSHGIQGSPHDMVAHPRKVLDTSTTDQNDGVFLQVVSDAWYVGCYFNSIRQPDTSNFAKS